MALLCCPGCMGAAFKSGCCVKRLVMLTDQTREIATAAKMLNESRRQPCGILKHRSSRRWMCAAGGMP